MPAPRKVGCWKHAKWLLLKAHQLQRLPQQKTIHNRRRTMKKLIVTLGCVLIAPLAFAQPSSTDKKQGTTTTEPVQVTGTVIRTTTEDGAAASYQPAKTLVVREDRSNNSGPVCSQRARSRCEQGRGGHPNRDQAGRSRPCLLRR